MTEMGLKSLDLLAFQALFMSRDAVVMLFGSICPVPGPV